MTPDLALAWTAAVAWLYLLAFRGLFWWVERQPPEAAEPDAWPEVVAVVPARDEVLVIGEAVRSLLRQDYPGAFSVVIVDDASRDGTAEAARAAAGVIGETPRFTVVSSRPLPDGWTGKMWAQAQAIGVAEVRHPEARLWLFTDADICHVPGELRRMVAQLLAERLDMASLMVRLSTRSLAERAMVPAFVFFFRLLYPFRWVNDPDDPTAAAAGGTVLIDRAALARLGGLAAIKDALIDDCALARAVKSRGGRIRLDLAGETASMRLHPGLGGLWAMVARSAYTQLGHSPLWLLATLLGMALGLVAPPLLVLAGGPAALPAGLAWAAMALAYAPMVRYYRVTLLWAPLLPLVALVYMGATIDSARRHWLGRGGEWKGRAQAPREREAS